MLERYSEGDPIRFPVLEQQADLQEERFIISVPYISKKLIHKELAYPYNIFHNAGHIINNYEDFNDITNPNLIIKYFPKNGRLIPERESHDRLFDTIIQFTGLYSNVSEITLPRSLDQRQITQIEHAVNELALIRSAFEGIPEDELTELLDKVEGSLSDSTGQERAGLIRALFSSSSSTAFTSNVENTGLKLDQLPDLILNDGMFVLISAMLEHPDKYKMQLGIILSQLNYDQMPDELKAKLKPHMLGLDFSIKTSHGAWFLCDKAEPRLKQSIQEGAVMAIGDKDNPYLLVKFIGKLSALCLQDVIMQDGKVFVKGNWYSPTDNETRDSLKVAFDAGQGRVNLQKGSWALMRSIRPRDGKTAEELVNEALQVAIDIPDVYPCKKIIIDGTPIVERGDYRRHYNEEG